MRTNVPERHPRKVLAATVLVLVVLLLLAAEALLALLLDHPSWVGSSPCLAAGLRNVYYQEDWSMPQADLGIVRYDAELTYLLRSGSSRFRNREFDTTLFGNSAGLRDDEESLSGPEVIVLGDSFAMGWGVERDRTFAQLVEKSTGLEVLNAGLPSYGTARQVLLLRRLDRSRARAVVVQYFLNDYEENRAYLDGGFELVTSTEEDLRRSVRLWQARLRYRPFDYLRAFFRDVSYTTFSPVLSAATEEDAAVAVLDVLDESAELADLPIFFLETDPWGEPVFNAFDEVARLLAAGEYPDLSERMILVSLAGLFVGAGDDYFLLDGHPNARGHEKIAAELERALTAAGISPHR